MNNRERAERARVLLNDDAFKEAFRDIEAVYVRKLKELDVADEKRLRLWVMALQMLDQFPAKLRKFVEEGELEEFRSNQVKFVDRIRERFTR